MEQLGRERLDAWLDGYDAGLAHQLQFVLAEVGARLVERLDIEVERLVQIPGQPPSLLRPPSGCRFHPRCPYVMDKCKQVDPPLVAISDDSDHLQACHLDEETKDREAKKLLESTMAQAS